MRRLLRKPSADLPSLWEARPFSFSPRIPKESCVAPAIRPCCSDGARLRKSAVWMKYYRLIKARIKVDKLSHQYDQLAEESGSASLGEEDLWLQPFFRRSL